MTSVLDCLTPETERLLERAYREALSRGQNAVDPVHIVQALARDARLAVADLERAAKALKKAYV